MYLQIKKVLIKLSLFTLLFLIVLLVADIVITNGLRKSHYKEFNDWNKIFRGEINADLTIIGSSKAWVHVSPTIIDSVLGTNSYNLGIDGQDFLIQNLKHDIYLDYNKHPKTIILIAGSLALEQNKGLYGLFQFLPYLTNSRIRNETRKYKGIEFFDYYIPFLRYSKRFEMIKNGLNNFLKADTINYFDTKTKGYQGQNKDWNTSFHSFMKKHPKGITGHLTPELINLFNEKLKEWKNAGCNVFVVYSPTYIEAHKYIKNREEIIDLYKKTTKKHGAFFLDYSDSYLVKSKTHFYNSQHLNKKGSEIFSRMLAKDIKAILEEKQ